MKKIEKQVQEDLFNLRDEGYKQFHSKLMPNIKDSRIIGVRTPVLKKYAKDFSKNEKAFEYIDILPHRYYEENNLHGLLLNSLDKDLDVYMDKLEKFLPYIDNWATCDMMSPKIFKKNPEKVYRYILKWLKSEHAYTVRFAIVSLMGFYLDDNYSPDMLKLVADAADNCNWEDEYDNYYVKMGAAWYFSFALIKQYDTAVKYFENPVMDKWTHNKSIQKTIESYRVSDDKKQYLRTLKIK